MKVATESPTPVIPRPLRILVADDHELVRQGLRTLLEAQPRWQVCGEAATGQEAVAIAGHTQPDVVVLDIQMPVLDGLEAARKIRAVAPHAEILILTVDASPQNYLNASTAGARAVIGKSDAADELVAAVSTIARHEPYTSTKRMPAMPGAAPKPTPASNGLTDRERAVVILVADGRSNKEVASALSISPKTVETHRRNAMHKLNLHSTAELVRYAVRTGLVPP